MANLLRASLIRRGALTGMAAAGMALLTGTRAPAQAPAGAGGALPHESGNDPLGKSLGYTDEASQVDKAKYPTYRCARTAASSRAPWGRSMARARFSWARTSAPAAGACHLRRSELQRRRA